MTILTRLLGLVLAGLLATACSGTKMGDSWSSQNYKGQIENVYIIGIAKSELNRMVFEDTFESRLTSEGVKALSSYKDLPVNQEADRQTVMQRMSANNCDSVLMTRVISQRTEKITEAPSGSYRYTYSPGPYYGNQGAQGQAIPAQNWGDYYLSRSGHGTLTYSQPSSLSSVILTVESVLYDLQTEELIWSARLETTVEGNMENMMQRFVDEVIKDLKGKGLL